jgi:putative DNA primase/helicase
VVACANGLLHISTRQLIGHTPRYFNQVAVPFEFTPAIPEPSQWLEFLDQLWPEDPPPTALEPFGFHFDFLAS